MRSVPALLWPTVADAPDRRALVLDDRATTYGEFGDLVERSARALGALGVGPGDRVATVLPNGIEQIAVLFATTTIGAVVVPLNARASAAELQHTVAASRAGVVISAVTAAEQGDVAERVQQIDPRAVPDLRHVAGVGADVPAEWLEWQALTDEQPSGPVPSASAGPDDLAMILFTSGSTQRPKGCLLPHRSLVESSLVVGDGVLHVGPDDGVWDPCPLFHLSGIEPLLFSVASAGTYISAARLDAGQSLATIEREAPTIGWPAFEALWRPVLDHPDYEARRLSSLRALFCVGSDQLLNELRDRLPGTVNYLGYGSTEAGGNVCFSPRPVGPDRTMPLLPGVEAEVRDESGVPVAAGTIGTIWLRGRQLMTGYLDAGRDGFDEAGWFDTGDLGRTAPAGLTYLGRAKDMLKVGGENVAAAEIESCLLEHAAVRAAAVVGRPDRRLTEVPVAFVEFAPGRSAGEEELLQHCRAHLARFKVPRRVIVVDEWPMSATKVHKPTLAARAAELG